ncbi:hypothetical protein ACQEVF_57615 [Nonomuraea polychroma]|uniref:hypothetical protein n=1 Tax=Nonomuraea polychroma TaxID=46176 RepID=UPI003D920E59
MSTTVAGLSLDVDLRFRSAGPVEEVAQQDDRGMTFLDVLTELTRFLTAAIATGRRCSKRPLAEPPR